MTDQLTLLDASKLISVHFASLHDAEVALSNAIEHGELPASIQRWATEQWHGKQLPGNLNRLETTIKKSDLVLWIKSQSLA